MAISSSRNNLNLFSDSDRLLQALHSLDSDLAVPYAYRAPKFENNEKLQLNDALREVAQRERDLVAAIGIAKALLDHSREFVDKIKVLESENLGLASKNNELIEEVSAVKEELNTAEDRIDVCEEQISLYMEENRALTSYKHKSVHSGAIDFISIDRFNAEISDMTAKFREEYDVALSKI